MFAWAKQYPDIYDICKRFNLIELNNPKHIYYQEFDSLMQDGPQCGLVALAICMKEPTKDTVNNLLFEAQISHYTYNGEMFSANNMAKLAKKYLPNKVTLFNGFLESREIKEFLLGGGIMLVPYDSDKNHAPCQKKGHKAHWALIVGIIECNETYIVARHGKSKWIAIWNLIDLAQSNAQLEEFSPDRMNDSLKYMLPDEGLDSSNGLKCKSICIWPKNS